MLEVYSSADVGKLRKMASWEDWSVLAGACELFGPKFEETDGMEFVDQQVLEYKEEVSLIDLLRALPAEVIQFDANGWLEVFNNWKVELKKQQKLLADLRKSSFASEMINLKKGNTEGFNDTYKEVIKIKLIAIYMLKIQLKCIIQLKPK